MFDQSFQIRDKIDGHQRIKRFMVIGATNTDYKVVRFNGPHCARTIFVIHVINHFAVPDLPTNSIVAGRKDSHSLVGVEVRKNGRICVGMFQVFGIPKCQLLLMIRVSQVQQFTKQCGPIQQGTD